MKLEISRAHYPVTVLGPGRRIGIWFQGCSIECAGCVSRDTWNRDDSKAVEIDILLAWCRSVAKGGVDGVTLTGGEPFDQPEGLEALLGGLASWRRASGIKFDILCYSGYPWAKLSQLGRSSVSLLDAVIPEPFVAYLPPTHIWRGSSNQPLVVLSELGRERYTQYADASPEKRIQLVADAGQIHYIGIPQRGDMQKASRAGEAEGLVLRGVSWRK